MAEEKGNRTVTVERHLARRFYQMKDGRWSTYYLARFVDKRTGKQRSIRLLDDLPGSRKLLRELEAQNVVGHDFDAEKKLRAQREAEAEQQRNRLTVAQWLLLVPDLPDMKGRGGRDRSEGTRAGDEVHHGHLSRLLGEVPARQGRQQAPGELHQDQKDGTHHATGTAL
jgi:hypothetical protein